MKTKHMHRAIYAAAGLTWMSLASGAKAQSIAVDGSLDAAYGNPLAVQTNNTQFGDNGSDTTGNSTGGSELDTAYGNISGGTLYLFIAGNLEANYNHMNIFIADGRTSGQSTLQTAGTLGAMNGSKFSPGFLATYALDINGGGGNASTGTPPTEYVNTNDLTNTTSTNYIGNFTTGTGSATVLNGLSFSFNNGNTAGVTGGQSNASSSAASSVYTGLEIAIPLSALGSPHGNIEVLADVNGSNDGYLSNQFLPGLPTIEPNVGGSSTYSLSGNSAGFNFSSTPGEYFTVTAPVVTGVNSVWLATGSGSWSSTGNWSAGIPNSAGDIANFNSSNTAAAIVTLDGDHTVGQIQFNSANSYNISQGTGGVLTINDTGDVAGVNPLITVNTGSHIISAPVNMSAGLTVTTTQANASLAVSGRLAGAGGITKTGPGSLILSGSNSYTGNITVLNGSVELDNPTAASSGTVYLGDTTADAVFTSLNLGVSGLTIATPVVTNYDDAATDNARAIAAIYNSGTSTLTGTVSVNGGLVLSAPVGATLALSGTIQNGTEVNYGKPSYDLTVNGQSGTNGGTVSLTAPETYTGLTIVNGGTLSLAPAATLASSTIFVNAGGVLNFAAQNSGGIFTRSIGNLNISGGVTTVAASTLIANRQLLEVASLSFNGTSGAYSGQLNLADNDLDVVGGNLSQITSQIQQGFNAGGTLWTGQGIISSTAASNSRHLTALGVILNTTDGTTPLYSSGTARGTFDGASPAATDVLVKYTYFGDANLDGKVDGSDYSRIDNGFLTNATGWYNGDFNYDGVVNGSDYTLIDNAFNTQTAALSELIASPTAVATAEIAAVPGSSAVPEPTALGLMTIAVAGLLGRRRQLI